MWIRIRRRARPASAAKVPSGPPTGMCPMRRPVFAPAPAAIISSSENSVPSNSTTSASVRRNAIAGVSLAAAFQNLGAEVLASDTPVDCDVLVCSDDEKAKQVASELVSKIPGARALDGGKLENARIVESLTALLIGLNMRYKVHAAGIRFTGLPTK